jgi:hypothetical protein
VEAVPGSEIDPEIGCPQVYAVFLNPSKQLLQQYHKIAGDSFLHLFQTTIHNRHSIRPDELHNQESMNSTNLTGLELGTLPFFFPIFIWLHSICSKSECPRKSITV